MGWVIGTADGGLVRARALVWATGPLHIPAIPEIEGLAEFTGTVFHSARWDHDHDLRGRRVAVIGTGASAIQFVPQVQPQAAHLTLFQRTAPWVLPKPDRPIPEVLRRLYRRVPVAQKVARALVYVRNELLVGGFLHPRRMRVIERVARGYLSLERNLSYQGVLGEMVGRAPRMQEIFALLRQAAPSKASVLVTGESGTGKEMVARTIHRLSPRHDGPFVAINCAALPETLIESELFGHEKGSFTGASERRPGCFEVAQNGTLLLDEIGEMPLATQAKLLRILEDSKVRRLGGKSEFEVDVRVVAATNKVPDEAVKGGHLREDLFYRLNVFHIHLPALRERREDIPVIVEALVTDVNRKHECKVTGFAPGVMEILERHPWPGNVRELRNVLERAVILAGEGNIETRHLPASVLGERPAEGAAVAVAAMRPAAADEMDAVKFPIGTTVEDAEKGLILRTLEHTKNNKTRAAEILGISLKTLHNKLKEYGAKELANTAP